MDKERIQELRKSMQEQLSTRIIHARAASYDKEKRSVRVIAASEKPATMFDWERWSFIDEILRMDGMQLPEGRTQVPLLDSHDRWSVESVIGNAREFATVEDRKEAIIYFASTDKAANAETLVREGHLTDLSVGYRQLETTFIPEGEKAVIDGKTYEGPVKVTTKWELKELSLVPIGADSNAVTKSLRSNAELMNELQEAGMSRNATDAELLGFLKKIFETPAATSGAGEIKSNIKGATTMEPTQQTADEIRAEERKRVTDIERLGNTFAGVDKIAELTKKAIDDGTTVKDFKETIADAMAEKGSKMHIISGQDLLDMNEKDKSEYSIVRAMRDIIQKGEVQGIEREASLASAKLARREPSVKGFMIPQAIVGHKRALGPGDSSKGGYLIGTDVMASSMIELLRNKTLVSQLGARTLSGLVGNVAIPKQTGGATAYWLSSSGAVTRTDQAFGQLGLVPHRLVAETAYDKELLMQASIDVESFVREDLMTVLAIEKDRAAINGLGAAGEPLGILNTTGLATAVTFGAAATLAKAIEFETNVANQNADAGSLAYLTTPAVRGKWKGIFIDAGSGIRLWSPGDGGFGEVNGYRAAATKQVPSDLVIFGNWADFIFTEWAGIDVVVDPYTLASNGQVRITLTLWCDMATRHPVSFSKSTDSGAQ